MRRLGLFVVMIFVAGSIPMAMATNIESGRDANTIREQQRQIRNDVEAGKGRYEDISAPRRAELFANQDRVDSLLKDVDATSELSQTEQLEVSNALESIQTIVNAAEDDRMVCRHERIIGSNRKERVCKTVAQIRKDREEAQTRLMGPRNCGDASCMSR